MAVHSAAIRSSQQPQISNKDRLGLYRRIFAESADAIAIIDARGQYLEQNQAHRSMTGYSDQELTGRTPSIHLGEDTFAEIATALQRDGRFHGEVTSRDKLGRARVIDLSAFSVLDESGKVVCFVGVKRDMTERRRAEDERDARIRELQSVYSLTSVLNQSVEIEQIYDAALDAVMSTLGSDRASILVFDEDDVMRFKRWRGLSEEYRAAVEGHSPWKRQDLDPSPVTVTDVQTEASLSDYRQIFSDEDVRALAFIPLVYEHRLLGKFMLYYNEPHEFSGQEIRVAQALAAPVAAALERRRQQGILSRSEQLASAGRLAASIAHEINNPLEAITNLVFLLRTNPNSPDRANFLEQLDKSVQRVSQIARQTLGFYRECSEPSFVDVENLLRDVLSIFEPKIQSRRIGVTAQDLSGAVVGVPGELRQVFANLISNAIDACSNSGRIEMRASKVAGHLEIEVSDDGHGMPPEVLSKAFEPFFTTRKHGGTGLGLWVTKQLVEKNGGTIKVSTNTTEEQHGTTVLVRLPVAPTQ